MTLVLFKSQQSLKVKKIISILSHLTAAELQTTLGS